MGVELSAKESAFLGKELATIKTDIESIQSMTIDEFVLNMDKSECNEKHMIGDYHVLLIFLG